MYMEIHDIDIFIAYCNAIRRRTLRVIKSIPPDKVEWKPRENAFSFGDIIRHLAALQRYMFGETIQMKRSIYPGHSTELAKGYDPILKYLNKTFEETMQIISRLNKFSLNDHCETPAGANITLWKWLRAMIEHEIHHRGQIYTYLKLLDLPSPPLYGLTSEEVKEKSIAQ